MALKLAALTEPVTTKGEQTRRRILETALVLFQERGYEKTTMRTIARKAGVSLGNAYYYFRSKDHLIQAYYARANDEHRDATRAVLEQESGFRERLRGVVRAKIEASMPYHRFSTILFKTAVDPDSPLNPFSEESLPIRLESIRLMEETIAGSRQKIPPQLRARLPVLVWLYLMGVILFWIYDRSEGCGKTYRLIDRTSEIVARLVQLASLRVMRPLLGMALRLVDEMEILDLDSMSELGPAGQH